MARSVPGTRCGYLLDLLATASQIARGLSPDNGSIDIAGILTASVAMGIAVNDTLHFVNWYSHRREVGDTREQAIADSFSNCGRAMVYTMLISCCSMLPLLFAEFNPTR